MKRILFIDRDGTLIHEPPEDYQVDSLEKLEFYPGVFTWLGRIARETDYELVMVTNQDGLGTDSFPEVTFWPAQDKMVRALANEGIHFAAVHIDRTFEHEQAPTRKPRTGMLTDYLNNPAYDLAHSYVIGDRASDLELARNLGARGILIGAAPHEHAELTTESWRDIHQHLTAANRTGEVRRTTRETDIHVRVRLDGSGQSDIATGLGFFDHMLEQIARHGNVDLYVKTAGDLHIDEHHTVEDTALALGTAFDRALGSKRGIERYGWLLPMDDCLARVAIDFGGRPWLVWEAEFRRERIGDVPTELFHHFFKSFSDTARCNLNIRAEGTNEHHKIEAIFKGFARAIKMAVAQTDGHFALPSTKGVL